VDDHHRWTDFVNYGVAPEGGPKPHWSIGQIGPPVSNAWVFAEQSKDFMQAFDKA
jgi:hypothetical protein